MEMKARDARRPQGRGKKDAVLRDQARRSRLFTQTISCWPSHCLPGMNEVPDINGVFAQSDAGGRGERQTWAERRGKPVAKRVARKGGQKPAAVRASGSLLLQRRIVRQGGPGMHGKWGTPLKLRQMYRVAMPAHYGDQILCF